MAKNFSYFNHPSWRRVISQLREIFNNLHNQVNLSRCEDDKLRTSLSEICLDSNEKYINAIENETNMMNKNNEDDLKVYESFKLILTVWKLCQIIFIKSPPSGLLLLDLQNWYRSTNNIDPMIQELFSNYSSNIENIYQDQNYWLLILIAVAQGRIDTARHLISFHPSKTLSVFKSIDEQMRTMPNFQSLGHLSLFEFKTKWEFWQKKCIQVLTNENFSDESTGSLEIICKMLCGDEKTFLELKPIFNSWYYMLISFVSYSNPTFNISDLHFHLSSKTCLKPFEGEFDSFDILIHNIFDFDVENVVKDCVEMFENNLFSSHIMDILYLNGKLQLNKQEFSLTVGVSAGSISKSEINEKNNACLLHQEHLTAYASQLLSAFWPIASLSMNRIAFDYLLKCKNDNQGMEMIEMYMEKMPLTYMSEFEANKLFNLAFEYGFHDLAFSIGRVMQSRALKKSQYGTSLCWNLRIKDHTFGTILAEKIIEKYFKTEDLRLLELTENLTKEIIYCDRLIFLCKYREFLKITKYSKTVPGKAKLAEAKKATSIIVQLLEANNLVPIKYRKRLIMDVLPLLKQGIFTEDQIFSVLRAIQVYENKVEYMYNGKLFKNKDDVESSGFFINNNDDEDYEYLINIDEEKWKELIFELNDKLADVFALKPIEIESQ